MQATNFSYDMEELSDYGMMICDFNTSSGVESVSSGADITFTQVGVNGGKKFGLYSAKYDSAFTTTFQICKMPEYTKSSDEMYLSVELVSALQRWLCRDEYTRFKIGVEGYEKIYWNATFSTKQINLNGRIVGLELTMITDAPYAYHDEITLEFDCVPEGQYTFYNMSDEVGAIRPDMHVAILEDCDFWFQNYEDMYITEVLNCRAGETIRFHGQSQHISASMHSQTELAKDFNFMFPRIFNNPEYRENNFLVGSKCHISITYSPIRKIGL